MQVSWFSGSLLWDPSPPEVAGIHWAYPCFKWMCQYQGRTLELTFLFLYWSRALKCQSFHLSMFCPKHGVRAHLLNSLLAVQILIFGSFMLALLAQRGWNPAEFRRSPPLSPSLLANSWGNDLTALMGQRSYCPVSLQWNLWLLWAAVQVYERISW